MRHSPVAAAGMRAQADQIIRGVMLIPTGRAVLRLLAANTMTAVLVDYNELRFRTPRYSAMQ